MTRKEIDKDKSQGLALRLQLQKRYDDQGLFSSHCSCGLVGLLQLITASDRLTPLASSYNKLQPNLEPFLKMSADA
jgi:hypothetical protein